MDQADEMKLLRELYSPSHQQPVVVEVPAMLFLMVDGSGAPEDNPKFQDALGALQRVMHVVGLTLKERVMPVEALYGAPQGHGPSMPTPEEWRWRLMIMQPDHMIMDLFDEAREDLRRMGRGSQALDRMRLEMFAEGLCVQILHRGPYEAQGETIKRLFAFTEAQGFDLRGFYHEIYVSQPSRTPGAPVTTVLRHPVQLRQTAEAAPASPKGA